jgi:hypothetical protein
VLPGGDARTRPRSHTSIYVSFGSVRPILEGWTATRAHLREITAADAMAALDPLRGRPRRNASCSARAPIAASTGAPSAVGPELDRGGQYLHEARELVRLTSWVAHRLRARGSFRADHLTRAALETLDRCEPGARRISCRVPSVVLPSAAAGLTLRDS